MRPLRRLVLAALLLGAGTVSAAEAAEAPTYVGTQACVACHAAEAEAWRGSHHQLAWTLPAEDTVLGDFDDARFEHHGVVSRFFRRDEGYWVEADGPDGAPTVYEVVGVAGIAPLQQYLVETEPGRLQPLDVAWDAVKGRWYHLYPDQRLAAGDGLHWTGPYKTWNARCAECHATDYQRRYDARSRRYDSREAEIGVGCEACHGPGSAHLAWAEGRAPGLTAAGFPVGFSAEAPKTEIETCAGCHSRREALLDGLGAPGTPYDDAYRLMLLREGMYHADGQILEEVYVYGSFLQSKMHQRGVRCSDCHDPHAARLRAEGDAVCTQCHSPAGNPRFPTLRKAAYDDPAHHFHAEESAGAECKSCHMIERVYMGVDGRRDHSFRIPRPDLAGATGAPDACTDCHADRDPAWAAAEIARRFPGGASTRPHYGVTLALGRRSPEAAELRALAADESQPAIVRATALDLAASAPSAALAEIAAPLLADPDPLVRQAALAAQRGAPPAERVGRLLPLITDPARSVRIAAAREFLALPVARLPRGIAAEVGAAMGEWQASLANKADFPETHLALGGAALVLRDLGAAEAAFREAVRLDPQRIEAWRMLARLRLAVDDRAGARAVLAEALARVEDPELRALSAQLGD